MKMVEKLNRLMKECYAPSDEEYESTYEVEYNSDDEHPKKRYLTDDDIYADNGYDGDFDMPDAYADRIRDIDYYNQYESLKRGHRIGRRVNESKSRRVNSHSRRIR